MLKKSLRISGVCKIKSLEGQLDAMNSILCELKNDKEQTQAQQSVTSLMQRMETAIEKIRTAKAISEKEITAMYSELLAACEVDLKKLKTVLEHQKNRDEEERLRKIQEEMARAMRLKQEEERQKQLELEQHMQKLEIEARRKLEEEEHRKAEVAEAKNREANEKRAQLQQEEALRVQQAAEQEKRDHDLALRLASELSNSEVDPIKISPKRVLATGSSSSSSSSPSPPPASNKKHDLSKWKYAELRDAINTSCDLELLEACREEFHRRLKVYHAWKSKNKKQPGEVDAAEGGGAEAERAPQSIITGIGDFQMSGGCGGGNKKLSGGKLEQRFFRIPFARPADQNRAGSDHKKGWWYAHFDGKWIARQMEIYEDKPASLLLAGLDDMHMCELSLEETGLSMKQGAEILESEFETVWTKNGGGKYMKDHFGQISSKYVLQIMQRK